MMSEITVIFLIIIFLTIIFLSGNFFYILEVKTATRKLMDSLNVNLLELNYSFEQMVFFHSLPSNIPTIKNASKENLSIEFSYNSPLFRKLQGIKIYVKRDGETILLAFLATSNFRLPRLDLLQNQGKINETDYLKIATYRLIHTQTLNEITNEVYKQMKIGRYQVANHS
jgi:hypothetical protein